MPIGGRKGWRIRAPKLLEQGAKVWKCKKFLHVLFLHPCWLFQLLSAFYGCCMDWIISKMNYIVLAYESHTLHCKWIVSNVKSQDTDDWTCAGHTPNVFSQACDPNNDGRVEHRWEFFSLSISKRNNTIQFNKCVGIILLYYSFVLQQLFMQIYEEKIIYQPLQVCCNGESILFKDKQNMSE